MRAPRYYKNFSDLKLKVTNSIKDVKKYFYF